MIKKEIKLGNGNAAGRAMAVDMIFLFLLMNEVNGTRLGDKRNVIIFLDTKPDNANASFFPDYFYLLRYQKVTITSEND